EMPRGLLFLTLRGTGGPAKWLLAPAALGARTVWVSAAGGTPICAASVARSGALTSLPPAATIAGLAATVVVSFGSACHIASSMIRNVLSGSASRAIALAWQTPPCPSSVTRLPLGPISTATSAPASRGGYGHSRGLVIASG